MNKHYLLNEFLKENIDKELIKQLLKLIESHYIENEKNYKALEKRVVSKTNPTKILKSTSEFKALQKELFENYYNTNYESYLNSYENTIINLGKIVRKRLKDKIGYISYNDNGFCIENDLYSIIKALELDIKCFFESKTTFTNHLIEVLDNYYCIENQINSNVDYIANHLTSDKVELHINCYSCFNQYIKLTAWKNKQNNYTYIDIEKDGFMIKEHRVKKQAQYHGQMDEKDKKELIKELETLANIKG